MSLEEAIQEISAQYGVYFSYNKKLIENYTVDFEFDQGQSLNNAVEKVLVKTNLKYRIHADKYVIIYSRDREGLQSLKEMAKHLEILISTEEKRSEPTLALLPSKHMLDKLSYKEKRLVVNVSGTVVDQKGLPLIGVNVIIKGTDKGTATDFDGRFTIEDVDEQAILMVSYIGYQSKEIAVNGKTDFSITLVEDSQTLDEVVVVGYGTQKKSDLTGAVSTVKGEDLAKRQSVQLSQALQGSVAGVTVTRSNNAPGSEASILIRGVTTIGNSNPLVIVDGVPGNLSDVNPNDVENISVLKDGASASIYGSRAAAGVILITTKRAKTGQLSITYNTEFGFEKPTELPEFVDVIRYMEITNELRWNDNGNMNDEYPIYSQDFIGNYYSQNASNPDLYPNTDWTNLILKKSAPRQSHVLSITGGSKNIKTKASVSYDHVDGLYERSYERFTGRINNDVTITNNLSATIDLYAKRDITKTLNGQPITSMWYMPPIYAAKWSDGRIAEGKIGVNPYASYNYGGFSNTWNDQVRGNMSLNFTPIEGLKFSAIFSPTLGYSKSKRFTKKLPYYDREDPTQLTGYIEGLSSTKLTEGRSDSYYMTSQLIGSYVKTMGNHSLNGMAGYENYYSFNEYLGATSDQLELTSYSYLDLGNPNFVSTGGNAIETAYRSYFGRLMYDYKSKYLVQVNIRRDGSSRFDEQYRWGTFPSMSVGWVLSEEPFVNNMFLKLRASYGTLGNERIGSYPYQSSIEFGNTLLYQGTNTVSSQTAAQRRYAIRDISWETTETANLGVDASFFDDRLQFSGDVFKKVTKRMLLELEIPDYIGFDNPNQNTGKMNTVGWETELGWRDYIGDFSYSISANFSDFVSEMGDLGGKEFLGDQVKFEGSQFNEWYGYQSLGLFQTAEEVENSPKLNSSVKPGDVKYADISGPDGVPDGKISSEYDRVLLGGSLPRYMFGGNVRADYKNFDFSLAFQGIGKQNSRLSSIMVTPLIASYANVPANIDGHYWSNYNTAAENQQATYPRLSDTGKGNNYTMSDFWLINGGYFRLKNVTLGYTLSNNISEKIFVKSVRFYASLSDILTIDNYLKGWDPEISTSGYPITSSMVFGLSVNF
ncbi:TonB-dependent receptor [Membranihabitans marinus]